MPNLKIAICFLINCIINANSQSLRTTYAHTNWREHVIFNINAFNDVKINEFDIMCWRPGSWPFTIYKLSILNQTYLPYLGLTPSQEWVPIFNDTSINCPTRARILRITLDTPVIIQRGTTQGFWFDYYGILIRRHGFQNRVYSSNSDIAILYGSGIFSNTILNGEVLCGEVYYDTNVTTLTPTIETDTPTNSPTYQPTLEPTLEPTIPTEEPTFAPTIEPTLETSVPSPKPTATPIPDPNIRRTVVCGERVSGSLGVFETHYYKLVNIPGKTISVQLNSCGSSFDTWIEIYDEQYSLIYEWYVISMNIQMYDTKYIV